MPTILNDELASEWLFGDLDEKRISEIGQWQFPSEKLQAYTIAKDFREVHEPRKAHSYDDLPEVKF
jgi:hypothetical protein